MYDKNKAHYVVVTGIIVMKEGNENKFLIAKRADWEKAFPGRWTVPGGKLEVLDYVLRKKDTQSHWYNVFEDILKREVKEEVNLDVSRIGYVTSMVYIRDDSIPCVIVSLYCEASGEIKLDSCLTESAYVSLEEAKKYDLIEGIYEELEMLDNFLNTGEMRVWERNNSES